MTFLNESKIKTFLGKQNLRKLIASTSTIRNSKVNSVGGRYKKLNGNLDIHKTKKRTKKGKCVGVLVHVGCCDTIP